MVNFKSTQQLLLILTILAFTILFTFVKPVAQPLIYHCFANEINIYNIHNFWNVISNIGFVFSGIYGLVIIKKYNIKQHFNYVLFLGFIFTGIGSAYYHYNPNNSTLVWDRLPMTIVFVTFFSQVYSWYFDKKIANKIWCISLLLGIASVWQWQYTETIGKGDLRLYALVQYLPILLMIIIVSLHHKKFRFLTTTFLLIATYYFIAKLFENFDKQIFATTNTCSGHPLKHLAAAIATYHIVILIKKKHLHKINKP